jgi:hypothetical protein
MQRMYAAHLSLSTTPALPSRVELRSPLHVANHALYFLDTLRCGRDAVSATITRSRDEDDKT